MQPIELDRPSQHNSGVAKQNDISLEMAGPPQLGELLPLVAAYHLFEEISLSADIREKSVERLLNDGTLGEVWLIRRSDHLIGYVVLCFSYSIEFGGREAVIDELYIEAPERGMRVGAEVLERLKVLLRAQNVMAIQLEVGQQNDRAKSLYLKSGFSYRDKYQLMTIALK
ncbi:MAG: GNAT family N-acetyltransferase [Hyphomicrobiales bacterium]|nr:GNAT family N-acetyltransferase [Hyphomicrobiales bacterium]